MDVEITKSLDERGEVCPVPDVDAKRAWKKMKPGEVLEIIVDYPLSKERIPANAEKAGHKVLAIEDAGTSEWRILIEIQ